MQKVIKLQSVFSEGIRRNSFYLIRLLYTHHEILDFILSYTAISVKSV